MNSDIKLDGDRVLIEGKTGIGVTNPARILHVEGDEIHSGGWGGGFSFSSRDSKNFVGGPLKGERWVWYASEGIARLWSGADRLTVSPDGQININKAVIRECVIEERVDKLNIKDAVIRNCVIENELKATWNTLPQLRIQSESIGLLNPAFAGLTGNKFALKHTTQDELVINDKQGYSKGVRIDGDIKISQNISIDSSLSAKIASINHDLTVGYSVSAQSASIKESITAKSVTLTSGTGESIALNSGADNYPISITNMSSMPTAQLDSFNQAKAKYEAAFKANENASTVQNRLKLVKAHGELEKASSLIRRSAAIHSNNDSLRLNPNKSYTGGVKIDGNVEIYGNLNVNGVLTQASSGILTQASSQTIKENINQLSAQEALTALNGLNPVKFNYKTSEIKKPHIGFIAEEVPELVAMTDRKTVSSMDIIGVLTKVVQEQQKAISDLEMKVRSLISSH